MSNKENTLSKCLIPIISLAVYFYGQWDFLTKDFLYSTHFLQYHLPFELGFKSLDKTLTLPTWLPLYQGGRAIFGDMFFNYSPFSLDFILTYIFSKFLGLDQTIGLKAINMWRMCLLNIVFAFGCRQFAKEILGTRASADLVFVITLFAGSFALPYEPAPIMANVFTPWILWFLTRIFTRGEDRFLYNSVGFTLFACASLFHEFNHHTITAWASILLFFLGLLIFGFGGVFRNTIKSLAESWKNSALLALMALTIAMSAAPAIFEYCYFLKYNEFLPQYLKAKKSLIFLPGIVIQSFRYIGILTTCLTIIGIVFAKNRFRNPLIFTIAVFALFATPKALVLFGIPLLAILAGMGAEEISGIKNAFWGKNSKLWDWARLFTVATLMITYNLYWANLILWDQIFTSIRQAFTLTFGGFALVSLILALVFQKQNHQTRLLTIMIILELCTFDYLVKSTFFRTDVSTASSYEAKTPDLNILDFYQRYTPSPLGTFGHEYIGNKNTDVLQKDIPKNITNLISGYTLPQIRFAISAVQDPTADIAEQTLKSSNAHLLMNNIAFLHQETPIDLGKENLIREGFLPELMSPPEIDVLAIKNTAEIKSSMIRTNIPLQADKIHLFNKDYNSAIWLSKPLRLNETWFISIDLGQGNEQGINRLKILDKVSFPAYISSLDASPDGKNWKRLGHIPQSPEAVWSLPDQSKYRFYRILFQGNTDEKTLQQIPRMQLESIERRVSSQTSYLDYKMEIPLIRFANFGLTPDKRYYIFGYNLAMTMGVDFSTEPSQLFAYHIRVKWLGENNDFLPTWNSMWLRENLFQIGYHKQGFITVNIPVENVVEYRKRAMAIVAKIPNTGSRVTEFGSGQLQLTTDYSVPGWLCYSDTWDQYWQATVDEKKTPVYKSNFQYKAVPIGDGEHKVKLVHRPTLFFQLATMSCALQFATFIFWNHLWQKNPKSHMQREPSA